MYIVKRIEALKEPALYYLIDLKGDEVEGSWPESVLKEIKPPIDKFIIIESITDLKKTRNGKKLYKVKFLHYPAKFDRM